MYLRFSTLADLAAEVLELPSRTELANRLGIALSTLNSYRAGTRFPTEEKSQVRHALTDLLVDAARVAGVRVFDVPYYVLSSLHAEERLLKLRRHFVDAFMGTGEEYSFERVAKRVALWYLAVWDRVGAPWRPGDNGLARRVLTALAQANCKEVVAFWVLKRARMLVLEKPAGPWRPVVGSLSFDEDASPNEVFITLRDGRYGAEVLPDELAAMDIILSCADCWTLFEEHSAPPRPGEPAMARVYFAAWVGGIPIWRSGEGAAEGYRTEGRIVSWHHGL